MHARLSNGRVGHHRFPLHVETALKVVDEFEWVKDLGQTLVVYEPIGVVAAITPWCVPCNRIMIDGSTSLLDRHAGRD